MRIDEVLLREIADVTGGRYFRAKDADALGQIFSQIDQLEKTPIQITRYVRYDELTRPFVLIALAALLESTKRLDGRVGPLGHDELDRLAERRLESGQPLPGRMKHVAHGA